MQEVCAPRGLLFCKNPPSITDADIVIAVREADGYAPRQWKSQVKLANSQAAGLPCVLNREAGYLEAASGAELWADTQEEMATAIDQLTSENGHRKERSDRLFAAAPRLEQVAKTYRDWIDAL
jgi:hypothetical protein